MHLLNRAAAVPPACLAAYSYPAQTWDDLAGQCKQELRAALVLVQGIPGVTTPEANEYGVRCAYCEGPIFHAGHIEHFRRKNPLHFPLLTFAWSNLFLACGSSEHCGHYKDRGAAPAYNPSHVIKPDIDEPDDYLYFHSSGEVRERSGLNAADALRARETIRVFGLDNTSLAGARARTLSVYRKRVAADLDEVASWPLADRQGYFAEEIDATQHDHYATTVKHFLQRV